MIYSPQLVIINTYVSTSIVGNCCLSHFYGLRGDFVLRIKALILALLLIFTSMTFTACSEQEADPTQEILSYYLSDDPEVLDPQIVTDEESVMLVTNLFEGLVRADANGDIISGMAKSWDISDDGLTYTFHLISGSMWSNGVEVTAYDFEFGITRALSPDTQSESASDLFCIKNAAAVNSGELETDELGVTAVDDYTLVIELEYETNSLLNVLTKPAAMPCNEEFFNSTKGKYGKDYDLIITNGPFMIRETYGWDHDSYIYIRRSDCYTGANTAVPLGVNFTFADRPADVVSAIADGEIDLCEIYGSELDEAEENNLNITTVSNTLWGICFNTEIKAFKNTRLRVSLLSSLDRDELLSGVPDSYTVTDTLIGSDVLFAGKNYRDTVGSIVFVPTSDPYSMYTTAREELEENSIDFDNTYTIIYLDDDTTSNMVTSMIQAFNELTGCYFNKEPMSRAELEQALSDGDYQIAVAPLNTALDSPMEFLSQFTNDSTTNYISLNYPTYDEFINTAQSETSDTAIDALAEAESYLVEYGYIYPLYYESRYFATAGNVSGVILGASDCTIDFTQMTKITYE